jgi:uncharacterized protein (DUF983 family)
MLITSSQLLFRAWQCRCPHCGNGKLFAGFLAVPPICSSCGLSFARADTGDGAAVVVVFVLGFLLVPLLLVIAFHSNWPMGFHMIVGSLIIIGATLGLVRPAKALMIGLQYRFKPDMFTPD